MNCNDEQLRVGDWVQFQEQESDSRDTGLLLGFARDGNDDDGVYWAYDMYPADERREVLGLSLLNVKPTGERDLDKALLLRLQYEQDFDFLPLRDEDTCI